MKTTLIFFALLIIAGCDETPIQPLQDIKVADKVCQTACEITLSSNQGASETPGIQGIRIYYVRENGSFWNIDVIKEGMGFSIPLTNDSLNFWIKPTQ